MIKVDFEVARVGRAEQNKGWRIVLHEVDGMSFVRFVTKDEETARRLLPGTRVTLTEEGQ